MSVTEVNGESLMDFLSDFRSAAKTAPVVVAPPDPDPVVHHPTQGDGHPDELWRQYHQPVVRAAPAPAPPPVADIAPRIQYQPPPAPAPEKPRGLKGLFRK